MSDIERIKERLNIVDVVSEYVKLTKAGTQYKGRSPFTQEKTASFFVSPDRGLFHCFSSGKGGDMITFIQEVEGLDFSGSLKFLAERAGIELTGKTDGTSRDEKKRLYDVLDEATTFFEKHLSQKDSVKEYVMGRGITEDTIKHFRIGYALGEWRALFDHLTGKGFTQKEMVDTGLIRSKEGKVYDTFRDRIVFPISDSAGRVVGFSGRIVSKDTNAPKYLNTPETILYRKSKILFGYDKAKNAIRKNDFSILVEGQMDLVLSHQAGFPNTVAVSGTSFTKEHAEIISRLSKNVVIAFDSDRAGLASARKTAMMLLPEDVDLKMAALPEGEDPADIISKREDDWKGIVRSSKHIIIALLERIQDEEEDKRSQSKRIRNELLPMLAVVPNAMDKDHFLSTISSRAGIGMDSLREEMSKVFSNTGGWNNSQGSTAPQQKQTMRSNPEIMLKNRLIGIFHWQKSLEKNDLDQYEAEYLELVGDETLPDLPEGDTRIFRAEQVYGEVEDLAKVVEETLVLLKEVVVKQKYQYALESLKKSEANRDTEKTDYFRTLCKDLLKELQQLRIKREEFNNYNP